MEFKQVKSEGLKHTFEVIIQADEIENKLKSRLSEIQKTAKTPGFRPGKVPLAILEKKYGQRTRSEIIEDLVRDASQHTLKENNITPAVRPKYDLSQYEDGKDLKFSINVESLPDIKPADFNKIKIQRIKAKVTDKEIDEGLNRIAKAQKNTQKVEKSRQSKNGDTLIVTMKGFWGHEGDDPILDSEVENFSVELGTGAILQELESQLTGKKFPGTVEAKFTFPENFPDKELAGKDARYIVNVTELREPIETPVDAELAKKLGFESLDKMREAVRQNLEDQYKKTAFYYTKRQLLDALDKENKFDLPESMVKKEFDFIWEQYQQTEKEEKATKASEEKDRKQYELLAERRVRLGLLLAHIGRENKIEVPREKIMNAVFEKARSFPGQEKQVIEYYQKNQQAAESIRATLFEDEVVHFILGKVNTTDKEITIQQLEKEIEKLSDEI